MENLIDVLLHKARCKAVFKKMSAEDIDKVLEVGLEVIETKKAEELEEMKAGIKKRAALEKMAAIAAEAGIDISELAPDAFKAPRKKHDLDHNKYSVTDCNLMNRSWSGMGHPPPQFTQVMEQDGLKKSAFLAENNVVLGYAFTDLIKCVSVKPILKAV